MKPEIKMLCGGTLWSYHIVSGEEVLATARHYLPYHKAYRNAQAALRKVNNVVEFRKEEEG